MAKSELKNNIEWISNKDHFIADIYSIVLIQLLLVIPFSTICYYLFLFTKIRYEIFIIYMIIFVTLFGLFMRKKNVPRKYFFDKEKIIYRSFLLTKKLYFNKIKKAIIQSEKKYIDFKLKNDLLMQLVINKNDIIKLGKILKKNSSIEITIENK
jgi:hypothetical protein